MERHSFEWVWFDFIWNPFDQNLENKIVKFILFNDNDLEKLINKRFRFQINSSSIIFRSLDAELEFIQYSTIGYSFTCSVQTNTISHWQFYKSMYCRCNWAYLAIWYWGIDTRLNILYFVLVTRSYYYDLGF